MQDQPRILLIEAEPSLRHTLAMILRQSGYAVTAVCHAQDVLHGANGHTYDLIFLDVDRAEPGKTGLLQTIDQLCSDIPLLILAASPAIGMMSVADPSERRAYLVKPVDPARMLARIRDILDRSRPAGS